MATNLIWRPREDPPDPNSVTGMSMEAEKVWRALQDKYRKANRQNTQTDPKNYYKSMYRKTFGESTFLYSSQPHSSPPRQRVPQAGGQVTRDGPISTPIQLRIPPSSSNAARPMTSSELLTPFTPSPAPRWIQIAPSQQTATHVHSVNPQAGSGFVTPDMPPRFASDYIGIRGCEQSFSDQDSRNNFSADSLRNDTTWIEEPPCNVPLTRQPTIIPSQSTISRYEVHAAMEVVTLSTTRKPEDQEKSHDLNFSQDLFDKTQSTQDSQDHDTFLQHYRNYTSPPLDLSQSSFESEWQQAVSATQKSLGQEMEQINVNADDLLSKNETSVESDKEPGKYAVDTNEINSSCEHPGHYQKNKIPEQPMAISVPVSSLTKRLQELQNGKRAKVQKIGNDTKHAASKNDEVSNDDEDLDMLEKILDKQGCQIKCDGKVKPTFKAPVRKMSLPVPKKEASQQLQCIFDASTLSTEEMSHMKAKLLTAEEVALAVVYTDGSSQLRPAKAAKKKSDSSASKVKGIALTFIDDSKRCLPGLDKLTTVMFPHGDSKTTSYHEWARMTLGKLMETTCKKICFKSQECIVELIVNYAYNKQDVCCLWQSWVDPYIAAWLLDPDNPPVSFADCIKPFNDLRQSDKEDGCESQLVSDFGLLGPAMLRLHQRLRGAELLDLFSHVEMPLCPILAVMDQTAIRIDSKKLLDTGDILKRKIVQLERAAHQAAGRNFLVNSHVQLRQVIFDELKLDQRLLNKTKIAKTSSGKQKSTSEAVLLQLKDTHPLPNIVLEHRQLQKLKSTYVDGMLAYVQSEHLHTHWDHTAAATGRLTSTNPNIQAIPKQPVTLASQPDATPSQPNPAAASEEQIYAREAFISHEGCTLIAADFKQIELRLLAHLSGDPGLLAVFHQSNDHDIFVELTAQWLGKDPGAVSQSDREQTKRIVYSLMYGAGKERLAEYLQTTADEAKNIMQSFLGYQCTIFKRRRLFPHIRHPNPQLRAYAERQAVNFCVQGSAADLCKAAMIQVEHAIYNAGLTTIMLAQIHDELLLEAPDKEVARVAELLKSIMESASGLCGPKVSLKVPLKVSISVGRTWSNMQHYEDLES